MEEEQEQEALAESLNKTCTRYKIGINAEKTKLMKNSTNGIQREIKVKGRSWVTIFKLLGGVFRDHGSKPDTVSRVVQATAAFTKLNPIWRDINKISLVISHLSKVKLM